MVGPAAAPYVAPSIIAAGTLLTLLHDTGVIPSKPAPIITSVAKMVPLMMAIMLAGSVLSGCSTLSKLTGPSAQPYVTAAVDIAVATAESKGVPAAQINAIAKQALAADQGTAASLVAVAAVVNAQLAKLNLPPGDLAAAQILEAALGAQIQVQIDKNPGVATAQAAIAQVLQSVIAATGG
jgi:uncharacterized protein YceK